jgi:hypothetical protein
MGEDRIGQLCQLSSFSLFVSFEYVELNRMIDAGIRIAIVIVITSIMAMLFGLSKLE